jgi:hypothetical protein
MTESDWNSCTDPRPMLEFLQGKVSDRKLRLFGCACCRQVWSLLSDKYSRKALTTVERYADAEVSGEKLGFAWGDARRAAQVAHRQERQTADATAMWAVALLCEADIGRGLAAVGLAARCKAYPNETLRLADAQWEQLFLLRDIFGNPFRPSPPFSPAVLNWNDGTVRRIAETLYEDRRMPEGTLDTARLAILADALLDAGCDNDDLIQHCREPGPHVRGCWALDLALNKE